MVKRLSNPVVNVKKYSFVELKNQVRRLKKLGFSNREILGEVNNCYKGAK